MKTITFKYEPDNCHIDPPLPASQALPDWWKKMTVFKEGEPPWGSQGMKACMPFFDAMVQGYMIPLWCDVHVKVGLDTDENGEEATAPVFTWKEIGHTVIQRHHSKQTEGFPLREQSATSGGTAYKFNNPWLIQTPPGYSSLFVAPLNNHNPNFQINSGIVATDEYKTQITFPFIWTGPDGYEGVIKEGTPIVQVIPFKRDDFKHELKAVDENDRLLNMSASRKLTQGFLGVYKKMWRRPTKSI